MIVKSNSAKQIYNSIEALLTDFNNEMAVAGYEQNRSKLDVTAYLPTKLLRELGKHPVAKTWIKPNVRHLGGRLATNGAKRVEVKLRKQAATAGWIEMKEFWFKKRCPEKLKQMIFKGKVVEAAISGLTSYDWTAREGLDIDRHIVKYFRALLQGKAFENRMTNLEIMRYWGVPPPASWSWRSAG